MNTEMKNPIQALLAVPPDPVYCHLSLSLLQSPTLLDYCRLHL